jgi:hypothetical protein
MTNQENRKIILLSDCAGSGSNCLADKIIGSDQSYIAFNLGHDRNYEKKIVLYNLKNNPIRKFKADMNNREQLFLESLRFMWQQELKNSWTTYIKDFDIINHSKNGASAFTFYKRLKKYEAEQGRPNLILLTNYTIRHQWQIINHMGRQYFLEKNYNTNQPNFRYNPYLKTPKTVQELAWKKAKKNLELGLTIKRNQRAMAWLVRYLNKNQYNYIKIKFYDGFDDFDGGDCVDCSDLAKRYVSDIYDDYKMKINVQPLIAKRVQSKLKNYFD